MPEFKVNGHEPSILPEGKWTLAFADEFDGDSVDRTKWANRLSMMGRRWFWTEDAVELDGKGNARFFLKKDEARNVALISDRREPGYDPIETHFRIIKAGEGFSLLEAELITGKPHQIRATLSHLGHPIVGDLKYGAKKGLAKRQLLHAYKVVFPDDILEGREYTADIPKDMRELEDDLF